MSEEQPMPTPDPDRVDIQQVVLNDIRERWALGRERYGTGLQIGNGRDMTRDALEEVHDLLIYLTGVRERDLEIARVLRHLAIDTHRVGADDKCETCGVTGPCHTVVDIAEILRLLGHGADGDVTGE